MTPFQIFLVVVLASGMVAVVICLSKGLIGRLAATCAAAVCAEPNWTTSIAHRLGISRGTDLLLYLLVLTVLYGFLLIYLKLRRVRRELTLLVREIAIREAERKSPAPQQPPDSAQ
jgi:hypothetical protein